jgi:hypothetical protein
LRPQCQAASGHKPDYVHDIAKVQIWCAWAEVNLGEAWFDKPVQLTGK